MRRAARIPRRELAALRAVARVCSAQAELQDWVRLARVTLADAAKRDPALAVPRVPAPKAP